MGPAVIEAMQEHAPACLEGVLIPNCIWKAGQSNNKIRKGGMVCIHALLKKHLVSPAALNATFSDLLPILKSCLDDSWSPDNRMIACLVLACLLSDMQAEISADQLREVYPDIIIDDDVDALDVNPSAKQIGGHHNSLLEFFELLVSSNSVLLIESRMDGYGREIAFHKQFVQRNCTLH